MYLGDEAVALFYSWRMTTESTPQTDADAGQGDFFGTPLAKLFLTLFFLSSCYLLGAPATF